jgi:hypothetical protein
MEDPLPSWEEERAAYEKGNRACIITASRLLGCTARRYDFPDDPNYWLVQLCFADRGPIAPAIGLNYGKYLGGVGARFFYDCMLQNQANLPGAFFGAKVPGYIPLDIGPEAMAEKLYGMIENVDLAKLVAAGSIERIFADPPQHPDSWTDLRRALCGIYLREFEQADKLLQNCLIEVRKDDRPNFARDIAETELYRSKLNANPEALRQELIATMNNNWSHFKVVNNE